MLALTKDPSQQAARALLASLDQGNAAVRQPAPRAKPLAEHKSEIQIVAYTEPGTAASPEQPVAPERTIRVPPLPVIAVHAKVD
jgi:hypothetical protein